MLCRFCFPSFGMGSDDRGVEPDVFPRVSPASSEPAATPLRAGIIGLDTSHVTAFTRLLNTPNPGRAGRGTRRRGLSWGSPDIPSSRDRVAGFTKELTTSTGSRSSSRSTSCSRKWTWSCSKAWTAGRTSSRPGPSSRPASRCSSTSLSPGRWPIRSRSSNWPESRVPLAFRALRSVSARVSWS